MTACGPAFFITLPRAATKSGRCAPGTQRQMDVFTVRKLCDIGDQFAEGHVRFTTRSNIEFMLSAKDKVEPLINEARRRKASRSAEPAIRCR